MNTVPPFTDTRGLSPRTSSTRLLVVVTECLLHPLTKTLVLSRRNRSRYRSGLVDLLDRSDSSVGLKPHTIRD